MKNKKNTYRRFCPNCNLPRFKPTAYCPNCGQKNTDGRLTLDQLLAEFSDATFNVDSRIFKTIFALFVPGKLTNEYFKGRHRSYLHPLRIFLVMTLGLIASATFQIQNSDFLGFEEELEKLKKNYQKAEYFKELDSLRINVKKDFSNKLVSNALDSLVKKVTHDERFNEQDSIPIFGKFQIGFVDNIEIALNDLLLLQPDSIINLYKVEGELNQYLTKQQLRIVRNGGNFGFYLIGNVTWMVFFMMPFLAVILKILYVRRNYLYVEHLIFSFHAHCFSFLMYIIMINFAKYSPGWIIPLSFLTIAIYLFIAMRNVYKQGRFKTFIKYLVTNFFYLVILVGAAFITAITSIALF